MLLHLQPCNAVGPFILQNFIDSYNDYQFEIHPLIKETSWTTYELPDEGIALFVENQKIVSISCSTKCLYKGYNLIGMNITDFNKIYGYNYDEMDNVYLTDEIVQNVYEFDIIGLQIWCEEDIIITVIVS